MSYFVNSIPHLAVFEQDCLKRSWADIGFKKKGGNNKVTVFHQKEGGQT